MRYERLSDKRLFADYIYCSILLLSPEKQNFLFNTIHTIAFEEGLSAGS